MNFFFKVSTIQGPRSTQEWVIEQGAWYEQVEEVGSEDEVKCK